MKKIKDMVIVIIGLIGSICGIAGYLESKIAINIGNNNTIRISAIDSIIASTSKSVDSSLITINIDSPKGSVLVDGPILLISGRISSSTRTSQGVGSYLNEKEMEIFPIVRPVSNDNNWFVQTRCAIASDGSFSSPITLGDKFNGRGIQYIVTVVIMPKGVLSEGQKFRDFPSYSYKSSDIIIKRK